MKIHSISETKVIDQAVFRSGYMLKIVKYHCRHEPFWCMRHTDFQGLKISVNKWSTALHSKISPRQPMKSLSAFIST